MNGRNGKRRPGFTLLEVMVAMAIMALFLVPILSSVRSGMQSIGSGGRREVALRLAQNKMTEIEFLEFPEEEGTWDGDFGDDFPEYTWQVEYYKSEDLQLMEEWIAGLQGMEVHLKVFWIENGAPKEVALSTILME